MSEALRHMFWTDTYQSQFSQANWSRQNYYNAADIYFDSLDAKHQKLQEILRIVRDGIVPEVPGGTDGTDTLGNLVRQLRWFGDGISKVRVENRQGPDGPRPPFRLANEYDVQDLLWVLIRSQFRDAVGESPTPRVGLSSSRVDIWIPSKRIALEVKYARSRADGSRIDKELKKDLIDYHAAGAQAVIAMIAEAPNAHGLAGC